MISVRRLTEHGLDVFKAWLESDEQGSAPENLLAGEDVTEPAYPVEITPERQFTSRLEFGLYLSEKFADIQLSELMAAKNDGLWAWIAVAYFSQLASKKRVRAEHYIVTRLGATGSLAYRHGARTSFELARIHGEHARVCLAVPMSTWGEMAEQLTSRQKLAHHKGFFAVATALYLKDGKLRRGASTKPKSRKKRTPGDKTGLGGARRLSVALQRLDLTYDTQTMDPTQLVPVLPREFVKWTP